MDSGHEAAAPCRHIVTTTLCLECYTVFRGRVANETSATRIYRMESEEPVACDEYYGPDGRGFRFRFSTPQSRLRRGTTSLRKMQTEQGTKKIWPKSRCTYPPAHKYQSQNVLLLTLHRKPQSGTSSCHLPRHHSSRPLIQESVCSTPENRSWPRKYTATSYYSPPSGRNPLKRLVTATSMLSVAVATLAVRLLRQSCSESYESDGRVAELHQNTQSSYPTCAVCNASVAVPETHAVSCSFRDDVPPPQSHFGSAMPCLASALVGPQQAHPPTDERRTRCHTCVSLRMTARVRISSMRAQLCTKATTLSQRTLTSAWRCSARRTNVHVPSHKQAVQSELSRSP